MLKTVGRNAKEMLMNRITEGLTAVGFEKSELDKARPGGLAQFRSFPPPPWPGADWDHLGAQASASWVLMYLA